MEISRSTRHAKIAGDFGEILVLYWLSKYGFECARLDHTGIDLIAKNPRRNVVMGISVKSRTRSPGKESVQVNVRADEFKRINDACKAFNCKPYFAIVVDAKDTIRVFIVSVEIALRVFPRKSPEKGWAWKMAPQYLERCKAESELCVEMQTKLCRWADEAHQLSSKSGGAKRNK